MRACPTGVFGSCLLLCAPTIGAVRGGGVKNCAPPLESEHESRLLKNSAAFANEAWIVAIVYVKVADEPARSADDPHQPASAISLGSRNRL
jgi:hypothetical protein